jgi:hypothetical protein
MPVATLEGSRVRLRAGGESDASDRLANERHPEIVRMYGGDTTDIRPLAAEEATAGWSASALSPTHG